MATNQKSVKNRLQCNFLHNKHHGAGTISGYDDLTCVLNSLDCCEPTCDSSSGIVPSEDCWGTNNHYSPDIAYDSPICEPSTKKYSGIGSPPVTLSAQPDVIFDTSTGFDRYSNYAPLNIHSNLPCYQANTRDHPANALGSQLNIPAWEYELEWVFERG